MKCPKCNDDDYVTYFTKGIPAGKSCLSCGYDSNQGVDLLIKSKIGSITHEAIILFVVLFAILIIFSITGPFDTTKRFCESNPEKCVCEDIAIMENQKLSYIQPCLDYPDSSTLKLRKKTQEELRESNPQDYIRKRDFQNEICLINCQEFIDNYFKEHNREVVSEYNGKIIDKCYELTEGNRYSLSWFCIKSRPKTECEKGNPSFKEICELGHGYGVNCRNITEEVCYDNPCTERPIKEGYHECRLKQKTEKCNDLRNYTWQQCDQAWSCEKTICREK